MLVPFLAIMHLILRISSYNLLYLLVYRLGAHHKYYPSTASPSDTDGSLNSSPNGSAIMVSRNTTFTMNSSPGQQLHQPRQNGKRENFEKPTRPNFLDLCQGKPSAGTPVVSRKPCFQFTGDHHSHHIYHNIFVYLF